MSRSPQRSAERTSSVESVQTATGSTEESTKSTIAYVLRWLGSFILISLVIYHVDIPRFIAGVRNVQIDLLALALCILVIERAVISARWPILVRFKGHALTFRDAFCIDWVSTFVGLALPSMLTADAVRGYKLFGKIADLRTSFSAIFLDRIIGILALGLTVVVGLVVGWRSFGLTSAVAGTTIFVVTVVLVVVLAMYSWHVERLQKRWPELAKRRLWRYLRAVNDDFVHYRSSAAVVAKISLLAMLAQVFRILVVYTTALSAGVNIPFFYFLLFVPLVFLSMMLPVSVGGIGAREASLTFLFSSVGEPAELGLLVGGLVSALVVVFALPGGLFLLSSHQASGNTAAKNTKRT